MKTNVFPGVHPWTTSNSTIWPRVWPRRKQRKWSVAMTLCCLITANLPLQAGDRLPAIKATASTQVRKQTATVAPMQLLEPISFDPVSGRITIRGDEYPNSAIIDLDTRGTANTSDDQLVISVNWVNQRFERRVSRNSVTWIIFFGLGGPDFFINNTDVNCNADGGHDKDSLYGGSGINYLHGGPGDDNLFGGTGNNIIFGGGDDDEIFGNSGSDWLYGDAGDDYISDEASSPFVVSVIDGGDGNDRISGHGDYGQVEISGGPDDDTINAFGVATVYGNGGNDQILGTSRDDIVYGGDGDDQIYVLDGNDLVYGGSGNDAIYGDLGHDTIFGQDGEDYVFGAEGDDFVNGGNDDDIVQGGEGNDYVFGGDGSDLVLGDGGSDFVSGGFASYGADSGLVTLGEFSDWNSDLLWGGEGGDDIYIADKKFFWLYLDELIDEDHLDYVTNVGWSFPGVVIGRVVCGHRLNR